VESAGDQIIERMKRSRRGTLHGVESFLDISNAKTVSKVLERLTQIGELHRVAKGMYVRPVEDEVMGIVLPGIEEIAEAMSKRDKARAVPTGSFALYKLGLTSQMPMNIVYYTDSSSRQVRVGNQTITFKKASTRNVSAIGEISKLVIQALRTIGKNNVTENEMRVIRERLAHEKPYQLQHDIKLAPEWIRQLMRPSI
jgi:predicted transcriptional regulator of viral defense system